MERSAWRRWAGALGLTAVLSALMLLGGSAAASASTDQRSASDASWEDALELARQHGEAGVILEVRGEWPAAGAQSAEAEAQRRVTRREQDRVAERLEALGGEEIQKLQADPRIIVFLDTGEIQAVREADLAARIFLIPPDAEVSCPGEDCETAQPEAQVGDGRGSPGVEGEEDESSWMALVLLAAALLGVSLTALLTTLRVMRD